MAAGKTPLFLNKIAVHLREQNWFALAAEFVIVVAGVFLGIQAANWNEERQERKDEEQILTRDLPGSIVIVGVPARGDSPIHAKIAEPSRGIVASGSLLSRRCPRT